MSSSQRSRQKQQRSSAPSSQGPASAARASHSRNVTKEVRRSRGEIACAECRRLKIRCDRKVPCSTCIARGCAVLCPNDVLPPGDNSRHLDFATDHLQQKIVQMETRVRLLEDALHVAQLEFSEERHPLLTTPFKFESEEELEGEDVAEPQELNVEDLAVAIGSLHINEKDKSVQFYGPTGGAESLLKHEGSRKGLAKAPSVQDNTTPLALRALGLPEEFDVFFLSFPFTPLGIPRGPVRASIEALVPPRERAEELAEIFMEHLSWMLQIVTLSYLKQELIPLVYRRAIGDRRRAEDYCPHDLGLLLIVLAIGALVDPSLRPYSAEAHRYAAMARTAANLQPLMENISLASVKFVHFLHLYNGMCGKESAMSNTYALVNVAGVMAQKIGLHVDPSHWNLDEKTSYDRRSYFWGLLQADVWMSLSSGRPPAFINSGVHCRIPTEEEEKKFQRGEKVTGFGRWGAQHTQECLIPLVQQINSVEPTTYQAVLDLEKKFLSFFNPTPETLGKADSTSASMRAWVRSHYQELILLFLHRAFFAKAVATHPDNPLESPYAHSFKTAYHCACVVLKVTKYQYGLYPDLLSRIWQIWTFAFTSAVIVGAVATRPNQLEIDPPPFEMFEDSCELFQEAATISPRAAKALPVLTPMLEKASRIHHAKKKQPSPSYAHTLSPNHSTRDDEVAVFAGKARVVTQHMTSPSPLPVYSHLPQSAQSHFPLHIPPRIEEEDENRKASHYPEGYPPPTFQEYGLHPGPSFSAYSSHHHSPHTASTASSHSSGAVTPDDWGGQGSGGLRLSTGPTDPAYYQLDNRMSEPVDFILDDTWSLFLQSYGTLPANPQ